ncbi:MAG: hypothetical protein L3J67_11195 [Hyphomicrobiaceae bacterium]|nr:hypothetical protein [Hyphomicrobiaceae bacterium]
MIIDLKPDMEAWLKAQVTAGRFSSLDEALGMAVKLMRQSEAKSLEPCDKWAEPYIDKALAEVENGALREWKKGDALTRIHAKYAHMLDDSNS